MQISLYGTVLITLAILMFSLFIYSLFQTKNRMSTVFSLLCLAMFIYTFFYSFEIMSTSYEKITFFLKLEYFGVAFIPPLWFLLAYKFYTRKGFDLKLVLLLFVIPAVTLAMAFTNDYLHLLYKKIQIITYNGLSVADLTKGIWYKITSTYSYILLFFGQVLFFKAWIKNKNIRKKQSLILLVASTFPLVISIIYLLGYTPGKVDPMPFSYSIISVLYYIAVFRYGFLEMKEIIRETSFEQINEGIIVTDNLGRLIDFNTLAAGIFNFLNQNNLGVKFSELSDIDLFNKNQEFEIVVNSRYYEFKKTVIEEKNRISGMLFIFADVTEKRLMLDKLGFNAKYDYLTEVYNRHELFALANIELYRAKRYKIPISFILFDLDLFKNVNDTYGHIAGDLVIKSIAQACKQRLRATDTIGRYGGEEFLLVLSDTTLENAMHTAENIRAMIEKLEISYNNQIIKVTVSLGVAEYKGNHSLELQDFINIADKALYKAKNKGRNRVEC